MVLLPLRISLSELDGRGISTPALDRWYLLDLLPTRCFRLIGKKSMQPFLPGQYNPSKKQGRNTLPCFVLDRDRVKVWHPKKGVAMQPERTPQYKPQEQRCYRGYTEDLREQFQFSLLSWAILLER